MYPEDIFDFSPVDNDSFDAGEFLTGLVAGAVIGAGLTLLFAPRKGEETRRELAESGAVFMDRVSAGYSTLTETSSNRLGSARDRLDATMDDARETVEDWIAHTREALDETRHRLDVAVEAGREAYKERKAILDAQVEASLDP